MRLINMIYAHDVNNYSRSTMIKNVDPYDLHSKHDLPRIKELKKKLISQYIDSIV